MTEGERELGMRQMLPLALIDVQVGPTESSRSNAHQDIEGTLYCGLRDLIDGRTFVVPVKPYCFHESSFWLPESLGLLWGWIGRYLRCGTGPALTLS
jgi:hypothetical protein